MTIKKDAVIIQIKTRKKKISNQNKTHQLLLFFYEKKETRKNPSHTYIPTTQNQNHIVVRRKKIFQISQKNEAARSCLSCCGA